MKTDTLYNGMRAFIANEYKKFVALDENKHLSLGVITEKYYQRYPSSKNYLHNTRPCY